MLRYVFIALFICSPFLVAKAAPNTISVADVKMERVGQGTLRKMMFNVYDATLWAEGGEYDAAKPHALELKYRMGFTSEDIIDRSIEEIKHAQTVGAEQETQWRKSLAEAIPEVKENDRLRAVAVPDKSLSFFMNDKETATIADTTLIAPFMNIWLGKRTTEPALRDKLLGK